MMLWESKCHRMRLELAGTLHEVPKLSQGAAGLEAAQLLPSFTRKMTCLEPPRAGRSTL